MGHSKASKDESHERIVQTAAARFREAGIEGVGVAELMKEAGLTHGGFYRHFASREELVGEAVELALKDGGQTVAALKLSKKPREALLSLLIDGYLSAAHRDGLASSCAVTTLAGDVARSTERARTAYCRAGGDLSGTAGLADRRRAAQASAGEGAGGAGHAGRRGLDGAGRQRGGAVAGDPQVCGRGTEGPAALTGASQLAMHHCAAQ